MQTHLNFLKGDTKCKLNINNLIITYKLTVVIDTSILSDNCQKTLSRYQVFQNKTNTLFHNVTIADSHTFVLK